MSSSSSSSSGQDLKNQLLNTAGSVWHSGTTQRITGKIMKKTGVDVNRHVNHYLPPKSPQPGSSAAPVNAGPATGGQYSVAGSHHASLSGYPQGLQPSTSPAPYAAHGSPQPGSYATPPPLSTSPFPPPPTHIQNRPYSPIYGQAGPPYKSRPNKHQQHAPQSQSTQAVGGQQSGYTGTNQAYTNTGYAYPVGQQPVHNVPPPLVHPTAQSVTHQVPPPLVHPSAQPVQQTPPPIIHPSARPVPQVPPPIVHPSAQPTTQPVTQSATQQSSAHPVTEDTPIPDYAPPPYELVAASAQNPTPAPVARPEKSTAYQPSNPNPSAGGWSSSSAGPSNLAHSQSPTHSPPAPTGDAEYDAHMTRVYQLEAAQAEENARRQQH